MLTKEDLQAISALLQRELEPMKADISELKEDVSLLKEESAVTRAGVEQLVKWANDPVAQQGRLTLDQWDHKCRA